MGSHEVTLSLVARVDDDGVRCDYLCPFIVYSRPRCGAFHDDITISSFGGGFHRCPACLAAEQAGKEQGDAKP